MTNETPASEGVKGDLNNNTPQRVHIERRDSEKVKSCLRLRVSEEPNGYWQGKALRRQTIWNHSSPAGKIDGTTSRRLAQPESGAGTVNGFKQPRRRKG